MPKKKPWRCFCAIELGAEYSPQAANGNLHPVCCCPLCLTGYIVGGPGENNGGRGVDSSCGKNCADVGGVWAFVGRKKDGVADDRQE